MYSDAMNNVETAISLDNTNPDFYILKGDVYAAQKDYTNALALMTRQQLSAVIPPGHGRQRLKRKPKCTRKSTIPIMLRTWQKNCRLQKTGIMWRHNQGSANRIKKPNY
jgi:hypothetical protein